MNKDCRRFKKLYATQQSHVDNQHGGKGGNRLIEKELSEAADRWEKLKIRARRRSNATHEKNSHYPELFTA